MKKIILASAALLCGLIGANAAYSDGTTAGHEFVDLGLTSGTLWATTNVGGTNPEDYGNYYTWGETTTKSNYDWSTYLDGNMTENDDCGTDKDALNGVTDIAGTEHDAAKANWGGKWTIPTNEQLAEIINECYWVWTNKYNGTNVCGFIVYKAKISSDKGVKIYLSEDPSPSYSLTDAHIFLPAAGYRYDRETASTGNECYIWSSSLYADKKYNAWGINFYYGGVSNQGGYRPYGQSVRAVCPASAAEDATKPVVYKDGTEDGHDYADLGLTSKTLWATTNVGAANPQNYGNYYAWGETEPQAGLEYRWTSYKYCKGSNTTLTKYCNDEELGNEEFTDGKTELDSIDDAAAVNWQGKWATPNANQLKELADECYWEYTEDYNGTSTIGYIIYKVKAGEDKGVKAFKGSTPLSSYSLTDAHIFLPAAGNRFNGKIENNRYACQIASSTINQEGGAGYNSYLYASALNEDIHGIYRCCGVSVRPVIAQRYTLTANTGDAKAGTVTGSGEYSVLTNATVTATANEGCTFVKWSDGVTDATRTISMTQDTTITAMFTYNEYKDGEEDGHGYVDLGLTSGTMWATTNIGGTNPEDYGNYYAWGETETQDVNAYSWSTYKFCNGSYTTLTKYCNNADFGTVDSDTTLEAADDAAVQNWGGEWTTPTVKQFTEIKKQCYWVWTSNYNSSNKAGYIIYKAKNDDDKGVVAAYGSTPSSEYSLTDAHIFLPLAGYRYGGNKLVGSIGYYMSSSLSSPYPSYAYRLALELSSTGTGEIYRSYGLPVRAVIPASAATRVSKATAEKKDEVKKVMKDGVIYIIKGEEVYGVNGNRIK